MDKNMEQQKNAARPQARRLTPEQRAIRKRRRRLRLVRNWVLFISACAAVIAVMASGLLWLLPRAYALFKAEDAAFEPHQYDSTSYVFSAADERLVLVNGNVPLSEEPAPELAVADDATGVQLEAKAAEAYRKMAQAAMADGVELTLAAGYKDSSARQADFDAQKQVYLDKGCSEEDAASRAATIVPRADCSEYATGYAADILSPEYSTADTGFAKTRAFEWLEAYAADYGFILRWPEQRQAATGMVYEPWHWRYVGAENAPAIAASGLSLEEFLAVEQIK